MEVTTTKIWIVRTAQSFFRIMRGIQLPVKEIDAKNQKALIVFTEHDSMWVPFETLRDRTTFDTLVTP